MIHLAEVGAAEALAAARPIGWRKLRKLGSRWTWTRAASVPWRAQPRQRGKSSELLPALPQCHMAK